MGIRIFDINMVTFGIAEIPVVANCPHCSCEVAGQGHVVLFLFNETHPCYIAEDMKCPDCHREFLAPYLFDATVPARREAFRFADLLTWLQRDKHQCLLPVDEVFPLIVLDSSIVLSSPPTQIPLNS